MIATEDRCVRVCVCDHNSAFVSVCLIVKVKSLGEAYVQKVGKKKVFVRTLRAFAVTNKVPLVVPVSDISH